VYQAKGLAISPDGRFVAVGGDNGAVCLSLYEIIDDELVALDAPATQPPDQVESLAFSPDSLYLAIAHRTSNTNSYYKFDGTTFELLSGPSSYSGTSYGLDTKFSRDGKRIFFPNSSGLAYVSANGDTFT